MPLTCERHNVSRRLGRALALLAGVCLLLIFSASSSSSANAQNQTGAATRSGEAGDEPVYREYRGARLGMSAAEVRQKLGDPRERSDRQDLFVFSENEMAQVYYDAEQRANAISIIYSGERSNAPAARAVVGADVEAGSNGAAYKLVRYPAAGYWVSYSRIAGETPLVTVTMQRIQ